MLERSAIPTIRKVALPKGRLYLLQFMGAGPILSGRLLNHSSREVED